jgi:hypothetical protein
MREEREEVRKRQKNRLEEYEQQKQALKEEKQEYKNQIGELMGMLRQIIDK